ncbi:hypothetical protein ACET3Z_004672 [Daucus carota]
MHCGYCRKEGHKINVVLQKEDATGEDLMMVELLYHMENAADTQNESVPILYDDVEMQPTARMLLMPTPGTTTPLNVVVEKRKKREESMWCKSVV